jgi:hypothetical protein
MKIDRAENKKRHWKLSELYLRLRFEMKYACRIPEKVIGRDSTG